MSDSINNQSQPKCPYCGHEYADWWDGNGFNSDGDEETLECGKCEKEYIARINVSTDFDTWKKESRK